MRGTINTRKLGLWTLKGGLRNQYQGWQDIQVLAMSTAWMDARCMQHDSYDSGPEHVIILLGSVLPVYV